jgi:phage shock protein B
MHDLTGILAIVFIFGLPAIALCGFILLRALRILKGDPAERSRAALAEDARLMQEIHEGLLRMEERIEALETIVLDHPRDRGARKEEGR